MQWRERRRIWAENEHGDTEGTGRIVIVRGGQCRKGSDKGSTRTNSNHHLKHDTTPL